MSFTSWISVLVVLALLTSCTPMRLYGQNAKRVFDPEYHKRWRQGLPPTEAQKGTP